MSGTLGNPFNFSPTDTTAPGFLGQSPSFWQGLAQFGGNLAAAANARTGDGHLANGTGLAAPLAIAAGQTVDTARQNALTRSQLAGQQASTQSQQLQNQLTASALPLSIARNKMLMDYWSNPNDPRFQMPGSAPAAPNTTPGSGTMPAASDYATTINQGEGSGKDPKSSAVGGFIDSTWNQFAAENPQYFPGMQPDQIGAARSDKNLRDAATDWLATKNAPALAAYGVQPTGPSLGMAHFLGPKAAAAVMQAPPGAAVGDVLTQTLGPDTAQQYVQANPNLAVLTASGLRNHYANVPTPPVPGSQSAPQSDGGVGPKQTAALAQQYEQQAQTYQAQANWLERQKGYGIPVPGDPAVLRTMASQANEAAIKLRSAAPVATATKQAEANVDLATAGPKAASVSQAELPAKLAAMGFSLGQDGNLSPIKGGIADPDYIGAKATADAAAKAKIELATVGPIAAQKAINSNFDLRPGGMGLMQTPTGPQWVKNPQLEKVETPGGVTQYVHITPPLPNSPAGTAGESTPVLDKSGNPAVEAVSPITSEFLKERGENLAKQFNDIDESAAAAKDSNYLFDNMRSDAQTWDMGKFAPAEAEGRAWLSAVAHSFGQTPNLDKPLADYQAFLKSSGQLLRTAVHDTSSRAAVQEYKLIGDSLPQPTTSPQAFGQVADQWQGMNDFRLAKQKFAQGYQGKPEQFNIDFNSSVSPTSFMLNRMSQTPEGQQTMQGMLARMQQSAEGRSIASRMLYHYNFAKNNGLFDDLPPISAGGQ